MKGVKNVFTFILLTTSISVINAQDIITKKNGDEIKAKVQEVGINDVRYKLFENESGPTYTLLKSDIFMIKYENGEKDRFNNQPVTNNAVNETNDHSAPVITNSSPQQSGQTPSTDGQETKKRKGYVGLGIGGAFLTEDYSNVSGGIQVNVNFGYLFTKNVGINASFLSTSFDLSNYEDSSIGLIGFLTGPLFSTATSNQAVEFDLRPTIGFASGSVSVGNKSGTTDETAFAFGVGGSVRWNCGKRVSVSGNVDYYNAEVSDVDLSSFGITAGVNFRF